MLLVLNSLLLTVPVAIAANTKSPELPACCRRDGKHKCGMTSQTASVKNAGGLAVIADRCPCCPKGSVQASFSTDVALAMPDREAALDLPLYAQSSGVPQTEARQRISEHRAWQKRGPPSSLVTPTNL
ncbi:hypothetical protein F183_A03320 [Bryobacterales bacterium F-183]|nr:hypothetical protein F183_A03320 [Bryobacterales bacterium F-183]